MGHSNTATLIFETTHGSHAYGLAGLESDLDVKGIIVGPAAWYHGYCGGPEQINLGPDHVRYEVRKFFRLAAAGNPTILEMLWTEPEDHRTVTATGHSLLAARSQFLSKRVKDSFSGYALAQLKRIKGHRGWLLEPPREKPLRSAFGLPEQTLVSLDQMGAVDTLLRQGALREAELTPNFIDLMHRERRYRAAKRHWDQYQKWLKDRNADRASLEVRFGYDTKHAQHLVRLLRMGLEILETGLVRVRRPDRDELLAIRDGAWSYDELIRYVESLDQRVQEAAERSVLPDAPDDAALDRLCVDIVELTLR